MTGGLLLPRMLRSPWRLRFQPSVRHGHTGNIDQQGRKKARAQPSCKLLMETPLVRGPGTLQAGSYL